MVWGYARGNANNGQPRNYCVESKRNILKQKEDIKDVNFVCVSYNKLQIPPKSIIYCDPPYANTTKYKDNFDHNKFWQWCRDKTKEGHQVFISEYQAPSDFTCLWEKLTTSSLTQDTGCKCNIERVFRWG